MMKRFSMIFATTLMLTGCGVTSNKAVKIIQEELKSNETSLTVLTDIEEKEEEFLALMDDILIDGEQEFDKASELIPQALAKLEEIQSVLKEQEEKLTLSEKKVEKINKQIEDLTTEESSMATAFLDYKNNLSVYLGLKTETNDAYKTFLTEIKGDTSFKDIELMIASLNNSLKATTDAYAAYEASALDFSEKYQQVVAK